MVEYQPTYTEEDKEKIIKDFLPFVKYTAQRLPWRLPAQLTVDDLISTGLMGLLDALEIFDGRVKLKTYAEFRIKGAMLDELRAMDWVPRSTKKKISEIRNAHSTLRNWIPFCHKADRFLNPYNLNSFPTPLSDSIWHYEKIILKFLKIPSDRENWRSQRKDIHRTWRQKDDNFP